MTESLAEQIRAAARTLSRGVKTRDVGRCARCEGYTTSGQDLFCHACALHVLNDAADALASDPAAPVTPAAPSEADTLLRDLMAPGFYTAASVLLHLAREHVRKEAAGAQTEPIYGPRAGFVIATQRAVAIMERLEARADG